jgi:precorrin-2 dehydrogenase/sirohydrochlorin ferrochelatase
MPKPYFALNLDVVGKPCLVVGGDEEALEKTERLTEAEAKLTVVGRKVIAPLRELCVERGVDLQERDFKDGDIAGKFFVLNCVKTDPALSKRIYDLSLAGHAIISAYDQPDVSNAVMMALVRAGKLRITIASNGSSPALAAGMRKALEGLLDQEFADYSEWVAAIRACMAQRHDAPKVRKEKFKKMLEGFGIEGRLTYPAAWKKRKGKKAREKNGVWVLD